jgi:hypothetical protein
MGSQVWRFNGALNFETCSGDDLRNHWFVLMAAAANGMITSLQAKRVKVVIEAIIVTASILFLSVIVEAGEVANMVLKWGFEDNSVDQPPAGFTFGRTGSGRLGRWLVKSEKNAPSGVNVLAQTDDDATSYRFPVAVADSVSPRNFRLSVRCKTLSGKVDQACGLVFRYRDENNYYVVRSNALENNIRLYFVKDGKRQQFAGWDGPVANGVWHELRASANGDRLEIYWNGKKVIEATDRVFPDGGKVGLWTKADSVTYFDELTVESLDPK